jgi:hypothetical protein
MLEGIRKANTSRQFNSKESKRFISGPPFLDHIGSSHATHPAGMVGLEARR